MLEALFMCVISGVQTFLTLLCVLQMLLGHYGCFFLRWATSLGVVQVPPKNFKMLLSVVGVFLCVANVVCGGVNGCKICYQVLFECCARCFSQVPPLLTPSLFLLMVLLVFFMVFSPIHDMFFYLSFLNKYEFLKVYMSFVDFVLSFLKYNNFKS